MKRKKGGRLRDREDRQLSAYARKQKVPLDYDGPRQAATPEQLNELEQHWRKPRATSQFIARPFTRRG